MIEFNDRRPEPSTSLRLTRRQRELVRNFDIGESDEKGQLVINKDGYGAALHMAEEMLGEAEEWGPEYRGVRRSAVNLNRKLQKAVKEAVRDKCPECRGDGCYHCYDVGKRLR